MLCHVGGCRVQPGNRTAVPANTNRAPTLTLWILLAMRYPTISYCQRDVTLPLNNMSALLSRITGVSPICGTIFFSVWKPFYKIENKNSR